MTHYPFWPYPLDPENPRNEIEAKFWAVHAVNPQIYERVDELCWRLIGQGRERYAVDAFFNLIRWHEGTNMEGEHWKMNNDLRPYYARYWLQNNEAYWGFFELRRVKGEYPYNPPPPPRPPTTFDPNGQGQLF